MAVARDIGAQLLSFVLPFGLSVTPGALYAASAVALVVLVLLPALSYRYAVRSFDRYTIA